MKKIITLKDSGQRLDRYLLKLFPNAKRSDIYKLFRKKDIKVNLERKKENYILNEGDLVDIYLKENIYNIWKKNVKLIDEKVKLNIVYEDDDILIVNKQRGILSVGDCSKKISITDHVQKYLKEYITDTFVPSPISRLDYNTSGLILFAKKYNIARELNEMVRNKKIKKKYLAVVVGELKDKKTIKIRIKKDNKTNKMSIDNNGLEAITIVNPIYTQRDFSLVDVELVTGRSHQIRVSMKSIGHAIVGDLKYNNSGKAQVLSAYYLKVNEKEHIYINDDIKERIKEIFDGKEVRFIKGVIELV